MGIRGTKGKKSKPKLLACTFGESGVTRAMVPADGMCDVVAYTEVQYDSHKDTIVPRDAGPSFTVLKCAASKYTKTTFDTSMSTGSIGDAEEVKGAQLTASLDELYSVRLIHLGMLNVGNVETYDDLKDADFQYLNALIKDDLRNELKDIARLGWYVMLSFAIYSRTYRMKTWNEASAREMSESTLYTDNAAVREKRTRKAVTDEATVYAAYDRQTFLALFDSAVVFMKKGRLNVMLKDCTGLAVYNAEMEDCKDTCDKGQLARFRPITQRLGPEPRFLGGSERGIAMSKTIVRSD